MDHVGAVLDCDYAPTGREFVSGGFDRTIRIFPYDKGHSREIYHTKRMQRVFCVKWSGDSKFVLSGSDETNIRLWKAQASEKLGSLAPRQKTALDYNSKLKEKYKEHPQVRRIIRHRNVPKLIYKQGKERKIMLLSRKRKEENLRKHSKPGKLPQRKPERQKPIVSVVA
jgi:WD repeat and SOF domain-containing protein 1